MKKFVLFALFFGAALWAEEAEKPFSPPPPPPPPPPPHRQAAGPHRRGPKDRLIWEAFMTLSPEKRQEMLQLQRTDPEKFRATLREMGREVQEQRRKKREEIKALAKEYREAKDEKVKEELKTRITEKMRAVYQERLRRHRQHLEQMKANTLKLETELSRREAELETVVQKHTRELLEAPPRHNRRKSEKTDN